MTKEEMLQKKLDIALKALELYSKELFQTAGGGWYENHNPFLAQQALKEIDLVGTSVSLTKEKK